MAGPGGFSRFVPRWLYCPIPNPLLTFVSMRVKLSMMDVVVTASALEEYSRVPRPIQARVLQLVGRLDHWPNVSGAKPLSGKLAGHFRLRTGE